MDVQSADLGTSTPQRQNGAAPVDGLSYKFQRLRERLRNAVQSGDLTGKLPGERTLARRFNVNAKTLSKALTDLAAEGLLDRSIGRGTYVKSTNGNATVAKSANCLIVCDAAHVGSTLVSLFRQAHPDAAVVHEVASLRPSFLKQFDTVVDFSPTTPDRFLRDLVVRNVRVIGVHREPGLYSVDTVGVDRCYGGACAGRDLVLGGHRRLVVVQSRVEGIVARAVEQSAVRYGQGVTVQTCTPEQALDAVRGGATGIICDSMASGRAVRAALEAESLRLPADASILAIGCCGDDYPCSGYFAESAAVIRAVSDLLTGGTGGGHRPATLWLAPVWVDRGTSQPIARGAEPEAA